MDQYEGSFIVAPFDSSKRALSLSPTGKTEQFSFSHEIPAPGKNKLVHPEEEPLERQSYSSAFSMIKEAMDRKIADKVVLARRMEVSDVPSHVLPYVFEQLCRSHPNAFVYFIDHPDVGRWMGASPETFLEKDGSHLKTVALAATRNSNVHSEDWNLKELEEQGLVSVFIDEVLNEFNINDFEKDGPSPVRAGEMIHLRTTYRFEADDLKASTGQFLKALHPTPAVGGYPKDEALQLIQKAETFDRGLYSGFLGPVSRDAFRFFVNIRCMQLVDDAAILYLGGGLTRDSGEEHEWKETQLKAGTLLSVLHSVKQNYCNESTHLR